MRHDDRDALAALAGGVQVGDIARDIVESLDPDRQMAAAESAGVDPSDEGAVMAVARSLVADALGPLVSNPGLRSAIVDMGRSYEQTIDETSKDTVIFAVQSEEGRIKAAGLVASFQDYIDEHKDEIRALQILYSRPYTERLTFSQIKELVRAIERPPRQWTPEKLWNAYETLDRSKVRGSGGQMLTDIVSLVRYTLHQDDELVPFREQAEQRFTASMAAQQQRGRVFTPEQAQWLTWMPVPSSPEVLSINRERVGTDRVQLRLRELGWDIAVGATANYFLYGSGSRRQFPGISQTEAPL